MQRTLRRRPSASMLVAMLAVVLASAGSATAARLISGRQIKDNSITTRDVKNASLLKKDFKAGQLPAGPRGLQGPAGAQGLRGPQGVAGRNGTNGFGVLRYPQSVASFSNGDSGTVAAACPAGTFPTGGDAFAVDTATSTVPHLEVITAQSLTFAPSGTGTGYSADVNDVSSGDVDVVVDVVCANANQVLPSKGRHLRHLR